MRTYPTNSPEAAARIVTLTMLADGHLSQTELDELYRRGGCEQLGLGPDRMNDVLLALCEDLLQGANLAWSDTCKVDPQTLSQLMAEIDDAALRQRVLALCEQVAQADAHVSDGESTLLAQAAEKWGLHTKTLQPPEVPQHAPPLPHAA